MVCFFSTKYQRSVPSKLRESILCQQQQLLLASVRFLIQKLPLIRGLTLLCYDCHLHRWRAENLYLWSAWRDIDVHGRMPQSDVESWSTWRWSPAFIFWKWKSLWQEEKNNLKFQEEFSSAIPVKGNQSFTELCILSFIHIWKVLSL